MKIVVPFTKRHPVVEAAAIGAEWHDVSADDRAYWRLMCSLWEAGESFLVIEHDVVLRPDVLTQFEECPEPWCAFGYSDICHVECMEAWANTLGCTRFTGELIRATPDAVSSIPPSERGWPNLCDHIAGDKFHGTPCELRPGSLRYTGFSHHWHYPAVEHLHGGRHLVDEQTEAERRETERREERESSRRLERAVPPKKETR